MIHNYDIRSTSEINIYIYTAVMFAVSWSFISQECLPTVAYQQPVRDIIWSSSAYTLLYKGRSVYFFILYHMLLLTDYSGV